VRCRSKLSCHWGGEKVQATLKLLDPEEIKNAKAKADLEAWLRLHPEHADILHKTEEKQTTPQ
jgi:hypothetical protein